MTIEHKKNTHTGTGKQAYSLDSYDYELPAELIAQEPLPERDGSKLMVLYRDSGKIEHRVFRDIAGYFRPGDLLVASSTPGHAMRWDGSDPCRCALVGKALEPMADERGRILVLLTAH